MNKDLPYTLIGMNRKSDILITVEHAGNLWPENVSQDGLPENWKNTHNAYDKGAADFALRLGEELSCPVLLGKYSRLFIDLNRIPGDKDIIVSQMENSMIAANQSFVLDYDARINEYYIPYHQTLKQQLANKRKLISIHSYTRQRAQDTQPRIWDVGIQYVVKTPIVEKFLKDFSLLSDVTVGDNKPYDLRECSPGVLSLQATPFGIDAVELEFCDDQLLNKETFSFWLEKTRNVLF